LGGQMYREVKLLSRIDSFERDVVTDIEVMELKKSD
jgi:hypothetical protein